MSSATGRIGRPHRSWLSGPACLAVLVGCATGSSATPSAPTAQFTSDRYAYEIELLPDWFVRDEVPGVWSARFNLNVGQVGSDWFQLDYPSRESVRGTDDEVPGVTYELYIVAQESPTASDLDEWTQIQATTMDDQSSCHGDPEQESISLDGEPAHLLVYDRTDCEHDHHVLIVSALHAERGYSVLWIAQRGGEARRGDFEQVLSTFRFAD